MCYLSRHSGNKINKDAGVENQSNLSDKDTGVLVPNIFNEDPGGTINSEGEVDIETI